MSQLIPIEIIEKKIYLIRGQKVMFDSDLAELYQVTTKILNQAVKRNLERFPDDFMFQLKYHEVTILRSQIVTSSLWGGTRYTPYVFTEQGIAMLSSVLHSPRAVQVNIDIIRTFVRLRHILSSNKDLARKLEELEKRYDGKFRAVFEAIHAIRALMSEPVLDTFDTKVVGFRGQ